MVHGEQQIDKRERQELCAEILSRSCGDLDATHWMFSSAKELNGSCGMWAPYALYMRTIQAYNSFFFYFMILVLTILMQALPVEPQVHALCAHLSLPRHPRHPLPSGDGDGLYHNAFGYTRLSSPRIMVYLRYSLSCPTSRF